MLHAQGAAAAVASFDSAASASLPALAPGALPAPAPLRFVPAASPPGSPASSFIASAPPAAAAASLPRRPSQTFGAVSAASLGTSFRSSDYLAAAQPALAPLQMLLLPLPELAAVELAADELAAAGPAADGPLRRQRSFSQPPSLSSQLFQQLSQQLSSQQLPSSQHLSLSQPRSRSLSMSLSADSPEPDDASASAPPPPLGAPRQRPLRPISPEMQQHLRQTRIQRMMLAVAQGPLANPAAYRALSPSQRKQALFLHRQALRQYRPSPTPSDQRQLKMLLDQLDEDDNDDMWVDEAHAFGYPSLAPPAAVAASLAAAGPAAPSAGPAAASNSATPDPAASAVEASLGTGSSAASIPEYSEWLESVHASSFVAPAVLEAGLARAHAVPVAVAAPRPTSQLSQPPARSSAPETSAAIYPSGTLGRTMSADHLQEQLLRQLSLQQQQQHELLSAHADSIYSIPKNTHVTGSIGPAKSAWKLGGLKYVPREESKRIRVAAQQRRKAHRDSHQQSTISRLSTSRGTTSRRRDRRRSVHRSVISSMGASGEMSAGVTSSNFESFHAW